MITMNPPAYRVVAACLRRSIVIVMAIAVAASHASSASGRVLVTAQELGVAGRIYEFDDSGNLLGTMDETPGGAILSSIATDGSRIIVAHANNGFRQYTMAGDFLGQLPGLPSQSLVPIVEFDARGNIYLIAADTPRRLNPDGTTSMTFPPTGASSGVDADAAGNVYITLNGIRKYSPDGQLLNTTPISGVTGDLAVDEIGQTLYLGRGTNIGQGPVGEILAYDISTPTPTFLHSIPGPPGMFGISFDPVSGNLFAANLFGGSAWEIATDGTIVQKYSLPGMYVHDVVAIRVPEIFSLGMLVAAIACGPLRRMRRVRSA